MSVTALVPWYGSNRSLAHKVGELLTGCSWVGVAFAGSMTELRHVKARTIVVNDLHRLVIHLARVAADFDLCTSLRNQLAWSAVHPDELARAQQTCIDLAQLDGDLWEAAASDEQRIEWARAYFVASWVARSGQAGTSREFSGKPCIRWEAGGGDSATRFRSAIDGLEAWRAIFQRCTFTCIDVFDWLEKVKDRAGHGIYCDPPFPGPGDKYRHPFDPKKQARLAERLAGFERARVVCRFYDHPLVREIYPEGAWTWMHLDGGKKQTNEAAPEVLLVKN